MGEEISDGEAARTANPAQTTGIFEVKSGFRGDGVERTMNNVE
jgi:hypothetical protein